VKKNRQQLDQFNAALGAVTPKNYESWTDKEKITFWINAYNFLTLSAIIDNYLTKSTRDIPGVCNRKKFNVIDQEMTLDNIEHQQLQQEFNEPRIHVDAHWRTK
jgi:hypothetical protein